MYSRRAQWPGLDGLGQLQKPHAASECLPSCRPPAAGCCGFRARRETDCCLEGRPKPAGDGAIEGRPLHSRRIAKGRPKSRLVRISEATGHLASPRRHLPRGSDVLPGEARGPRWSAAQHLPEDERRRSGSARRRHDRRVGRAGPPAAGTVLGERRVRRRVDVARGRDLHRGVPDQPADPEAVPRSAAGSDGDRADRPTSLYATWTSPPERPRPASRTRSATRRTRCGRATLGYPGSDRLQDRRAGREPRVHDLAGAADRRRRASRRCRSTRSGNTYAAGTVRQLPASTIYGFNGTFPGPRINAEYGKPALVRFENQLDENPLQPRPAGLRRARLVVPDPPAQRPHGAGERRQPALLDAVRPEGERLPRRRSGSTTCT